MIVYNKLTGRILGEIPDFENPYIVFRKYTDVLNNNIDVLMIESPSGRLSDYKVFNKELVKMTEIEIKELREYGRVLTEEERILESMKPSDNEIKDAEMTIEVLSILEGVI